MNNILQSFELIGDFSLNNNNNKQNLIKLNINPSVSKKNNVIKIR